MCTCITCLPTRIKRATVAAAQIYVDDAARSLAQDTSAIIDIYKYVVIVADINKNLIESNSANQKCFSLFNAIISFNW